MRKHPHVLRARASALTLILLACVALAAAPRALARTAGDAAARRTLDGHIVPALARASAAAPADGGEPLTLTLVLGRDDEAGFQAFVAAVSDPRSPLFRRYLSPRDVADRFGPSRIAYEAVREYAQRQGLGVVADSANRLTLTLSASRTQAEKAFGVTIRDYALDGRRFRASASNPTLPAEIAASVRAVVGLSDLARPLRPRPLISTLTGDVSPSCESVEQFYLDLATLALNGDGDTSFLDWGAYAAAFSIQCIIRAVQEHDAAGGRGPANRPARAASAQKIGLLEYDAYRASDVADFLAYYQRPASQAARLTEHKVSGGAPLGAGESEVLMDIGAVMIGAPNASYEVYDAPYSTSFQTLFNQMINDGVTVIGNSWTYCEDQTSLADVASLDSIFAAAAASGVTVLNATGDSGSRCYDGSAATVGVPSDAPHATAVGGASVTLSPGYTLMSATWWNGSAATPPGGDGGFGVSRFFARPAFQDPFTAAGGRSVPDLVAPADPRVNGLTLCQSDAGGCPTGLVHAGTSLAAPLMAAEVAVINERLGSNLGWLNPAVYAVGASASSFATPAAMASDFAHVGLGLPRLDGLSLALAGQAAGAASATRSVLIAPARVYADGGAAQVVVFLRDANGDAVAGQNVTLTPSGGSAVIGPPSGPSSAAQGAVVFAISDTVIEDVTFTAHVTGGVDVAQTRLVHFVAPRAAMGGIQAAPSSVPADGTLATITVTLQDANGNGTPGKLVSLSQGDGSSVVSQSTATTNASGQIQFTAYDTLAETVVYTATDLTDGLPVPGSASVQFHDPAGFCVTYGRPFMPVAAPGYAVTTFAGNFPNDCFVNLGPVGLAFDALGNLLVSGNDGYVYAFGPEGGTADFAHRLAYVEGAQRGLAFTADGRLYLAVNTNRIVELDPLTGARLRDAATTSDHPVALAVDPLSGDLFFSQGDGLYRVSSYAGGPGTVAAYVTQPALGGNDGIAFGADGTLYVESGGSIYAVAGTDQPSPHAATLLAAVAGGPDGIALQLNTGDPAKPFLFVNRNDGTLTRIDLTTDPPTQTSVFTGGGRGDFITVGPDACLYATQTDRVVRVTKDDGTCDWAATSPLAGLALTPRVATPNPALGASTSFTAALTNVPSPAGLPVFFDVTGANASLRMVRADAAGKAVLSYAGVRAGDDLVTALASSGALTLVSNAARVTWAAGSHTTDLNLNLSPGGSRVGGVAVLRAGLFDRSGANAPIAGATIHFDVGGQACDAVTDGAGIASCGVVTYTAGAFELAASYAGDATHLPASRSIPFDVLGVAVLFSDGFEDGN